MAHVIYRLVTGQLLDRTRSESRYCFIAPQFGAFPRGRALKPLRAPKTSATCRDGVPALVDRLPSAAVMPPTLPALRNSLNRNGVRRCWSPAGLPAVFRAILRFAPTRRATITGEDMQPGDPGRVETGHEAGWTKLLGE